MMDATVVNFGLGLGGKGMGSVFCVFDVQLL